MSLLFLGGRSFHSSSFFGEGIRLATPYPSSLAGCPLMSCHTAMLTFQNLQAVQQQKEYATHLRRWTFPNCDPTRQSHDDIYTLQTWHLCTLDVFFCTKANLWYIFGHIWTLDTSEHLQHIVHTPNHMRSLIIQWLCNLRIQVPLHPLIHHFFHHPWKFIVLGTTPCQNFPARRT